MAKGMATTMHPGGGSLSSPAIASRPALPLTSPQTHAQHQAASLSTGTCQQHMAQPTASQTRNTIPTGMDTTSQKMSKGVCGMKSGDIFWPRSRASHARVSCICLQSQVSGSLGSMPHTVVTTLAAEKTVHTTLVHTCPLSGNCGWPHGSSYTSTQGLPARQHLPLGLVLYTDPRIPCLKRSEPGKTDGFWSYPLWHHFQLIG